MSVLALYLLLAIWLLAACAPSPSAASAPVLPPTAHTAATGNLQSRILVISDVGQAFLTQKFDSSIVENENLRVNWTGEQPPILFGLNTWGNEMHLSIFPRDAIAAWGVVSSCGNNREGQLFDQKLAYLWAEWYGSSGEINKSDFLIGDYLILRDAKLISGPTHNFPSGDYCFDTLYLREDTLVP